MRQLAILGASGHGKVVAEAALRSGWGGVEFYDDAWPEKRKAGKWVVSGDTAALLKALSRFDGVIVAIDGNAVRMEKIALLEAAGARMATIVHPSAMVSDSVLLGVGTVVMAGAVVNADSVIGVGVILNTSCSVDHEGVLGDGVYIGPGAHLADSVHVGDLSWVGIGAAVGPGARIESGTVVGVGEAVV